jgi:hypothetical protein
MRRAGSSEEADAYDAAGAIAMGAGARDTALYGRLGNRQGAYGAALMGRLSEPGLDPDSMVAFSEWSFNQAMRAEPGIAAQFALARATTYAGLGRFDEGSRIADSLGKVNREMGMSALLYPMMIGIAPEGFAAAERKQMFDAPRRSPFQVLVVAEVMLARGEGAAAERLADSMIARDPAASDPFLPGLFRAIKGQAAVQRGDTAAGVRLLREGIESAGPGSPFLSAGLRLALANGLAARTDTRPEGIRRLLYGFDVDPGVRVYTYLLLGRAYEAGGDAAKARSYYGRFVGLWNRPSPGAEALVDEARRALDRLAPDRPAGR